MTHHSTARPVADLGHADLSFSLLQLVIAQRVASDLVLRPAKPADADALVELWHDGWHRTHAPLAPPELVERRTLADFQARIGNRLPQATVAEIDKTIVGFCSIKQSEIDQLYVAPLAWGTGTAQALLQDGLARLARTGVTVASLICAIGNWRAARFYEKMGWSNTGVVTLMTETASGPLQVNGWRLERSLATPAEQRLEDAYAMLIHVAPPRRHLLNPAKMA